MIFLSGVGTLGGMADGSRYAAPRRSRRAAGRTSSTIVRLNLSGSSANISWPDRSNQTLKRHYLAGVGVRTGSLGAGVARVCAPPLGAPPPMRGFTAPADIR